IQPRRRTKWAFSATTSTLARTAGGWGSRWSLAAGRGGAYGSRMVLTSAVGGLGGEQVGGPGGGIQEGRGVRQGHGGLHDGRSTVPTCGHFTGRGRCQPARRLQ